MKTLFVVILATLGAAQLHAQNVKQSISGTAKEGVQRVYLHVNQVGRTAKDSCDVADNSFQFNVEVPQNSLIYVTYPLDRGMSGGASFVADGEPVSINLETGELKGSALNDQYDKCFSAMSELRLASNKLLIEDRKLSQEEQTDEVKARRDKIEKEYDEIQNKRISYVKLLAQENKGNVLPAFFIQYVMRDMSDEELESVLDASASYYNHPLMAQPKRLLKQRALRKIGSLYTDLTMNDDKGTTRKLSEWCGKGNYVLIDFWASWCGPCRAELPNVVENYTKYRAKGFEIVGISFDNKAEAWLKAIKDLNLTWPQLSDLKGWKSEGAKLYGISSIPANVLLDGEGHIIANDLRGEALGKKLQEVYGF